jgi:hypothetical protein
MYVARVENEEKNWKRKTVFPKIDRWTAKSKRRTRRDRIGKEGETREKKTVLT